MQIISGVYYVVYSDMILWYLPGIYGYSISVCRMCVYHCITVDMCYVNPSIQSLWQQQRRMPQGTRMHNSLNIDGSICHVCVGVFYFKK